MRALHDGRGRVVRYVRLSVTDRCNLRCMYCRSGEPLRGISHTAVLRYEEMARMVAVAAGLGVGKVRLTGGEPFARKGFDQFLVMLRERFCDLDLRVTTNGTLLEPHIPLLRKVNISAVNLSLDSFDRQTFHEITGCDLLPQVLSALDAMLAADVRVKINVVAMRGVNDGQMDDFVHVARTMPVDVRFIEFMPMGSGTLWSPKHFWSADEIRAEAGRRVRLIADAVEPAESGPARMYRLEGGKGRLGFISPLSDHFCLSCNRLRLTSEGNLRTCLFADKEYRLRGLLRHPRITDAMLARVIECACAVKPVGAEILRLRTGRAVATKQMSGIGG